MPGIKIHGDNEKLQGAIMFFDKLVGAYITSNRTRPDVKFGLLRDMREAGNLYLTDVRPPNPAEGINHNEADLVGFKANGKPVCFKLSIDNTMKMTGFSKKNLENMSKETREMADDIKRELGLEARGPTLK